MTEEEKAEEYVNALLNKDDDELDKLLDENLADLQLNARQAGTLLGIVKGFSICSFLAGLKTARQEKWHDLRKDSNDLPKEDCEIITLHENGNKNIQKWKNGNWTNAIVIPVIAWCEIPTFTDK